MGQNYQQQQQQPKKEEIYSSTKSTTAIINSANSSINRNLNINTNYNSSNSSINHNLSNSANSHSEINTPKYDNVIDFNGVSRPRAASREYTPKFRVPLGPDTFRKKESDTSDKTSCADIDQKSQLELLDIAFSDNSNGRPLTSSSSPTISNSDPDNMPSKVSSTKLIQIPELSHVYLYYIFSYKNLD